MCCRPVHSSLITGSPAARRLFAGSSGGMVSWQTERVAGTGRKSVFCVCDPSLDSDRRSLNERSNTLAQKVHSADPAADHLTPPPLLMFWSECGNSQLSHTSEFCGSPRPDSFIFLRRFDLYLGMSAPSSAASTFRCFLWLLFLCLLFQERGSINELLC